MNRHQIEPYPGERIILAADRFDTRVRSVVSLDRSGIYEVIADTGETLLIFLFDEDEPCWIQVTPETDGKR